MRRVRQLLAALALASVATTTAVATAPAPSAHAVTSRAVVIVGGTTHVIGFSGSITGVQALRKVASVSSIGYGGLGEAVCAINGVGNPATPGECLTGPSGQYWAYFRAPPGASGWQYSGQGAGATTVSDGWVEGWRYGTGASPPFSSFCAVAGCPPPGPPPSDPSSTSPDGSSSPAGEMGEATGAGAAGVTTTTGTSAEGGADATTSRRRGGDVAGRGATASPDQGEGSPWGVAVGAAVVAALGASGWWIRRARRRTARV